MLKHENLEAAGPLAEDAARERDDGGSGNSAASGFNLSSPMISLRRDSPVAAIEKFLITGE
jgi:hypothetical protein